MSSQFLHERIFEHPYAKRILLGYSCHTSPSIFLWPKQEAPSSIKRDGMSHEAILEAKWISQLATDRCYYQSKAKTRREIKLPVESLTCSHVEETRINSQGTSTQRPLSPIGHRADLTWLPDHPTVGIIFSAVELKKKNEIVFCTIASTLFINTITLL